MVTNEPLSFEQLNIGDKWTSANLAEAKAAINSPAATGGGCGDGDTSQREDLLAKIEAKKDS